MIPAAYYNEIDPYAVQWLRNLIAAGHIAPGEVDERSIEDVTPDDLRGFTQCHFFAGIGVWSHSLRLAGWPDDKPVWTGSCPCQPFSAAGKSGGFADERHLWPAFFHLISECRPQHVFGEQVAAGNANTWFDLVQADLEGMGYTFGLAPFAAAGVGAPHIRERAYWVAHANCFCGDRRGNGREAGRDEYSNSSDSCRLADASSERCDRLDPLLQLEESGRLAEGMPEASRLGIADRVAYANNRIGDEGETLRPGRDAVLNGCINGRPLEVNGFWRDADWLLCRDGKWRPVEPGTFPLVDGAAARMGRVQPALARMASLNRRGRLKGYGNAINAQAAAEFIRAYMGVANGAHPHN
ncbi:DNA cytosine methyltransferase [Cronobacter dublinensis]|uniref:DNA cytosine methyltransferase n=1 Tax=Cronobacter dublinensis TaxID=413497 RepID=UPI000D000B23|nr:DNA cytosine methyltransferase [Cronobacter dublinensis]